LITSGPNADFTFDIKEAEFVTLDKDSNNITGVTVGETTVSRLITLTLGQRQETLDLPYLTLLCDNLKNRMFLQNFFS
jgi:hypothetical protein